MNLGWHSDDLVPVVALGTAALAYTIFHYWGSAAFWVQRVQSNGQRDAQTRALLLQRYLGASILGLSAIGAGFAIGYTPLELGLQPGHTAWPTLALIGGAVAVLVPVIFLSARQPSQWQFYPRIRTHTWNAALLRDNLLSWAVYLVGYELLFRGLLLFPLVDALGVWPGLAAMTAVYCLVHLPTASPGETLGTFPIGILFGTMALLSGSILGPILAHIAIASTNDLAVIRFNPDIRYEASD